ncbi:AAA family ATPase [Streptomyces sp. NPDC048111]|uniref:AAA family ATPase n=1 Tax=Streptomyces sp. NPDC048111 TaxID=3365500 RepID=UPI003713E615
MRVLHIDAENADSQARPWLRRMQHAAIEEGAPAERGRFALRMIPESLDVTQAADRSWLARMVGQTQPDLISIGSLYKLTVNGESDEKAARPVMSALEMMHTVSGGAAMLIEAHAPHAQPGGRRDLRPIGSSLWLRWPEFGFGLAPASEPGAAEPRLMDWVPRRGARSERSWPEQFCQGVTWPWQAIEYAGNAPVGVRTRTADQATALGLDVPHPAEAFEQSEAF